MHTQNILYIHILFQEHSQTHNFRERRHEKKWSEMIRKFMVKLVILLAELLAAKVVHDVDQHVVKRNFM